LFKQFHYFSKSITLFHLIS